MQESSLVGIIIATVVGGPLFYAAMCSLVFYFLSRDHEIVKKEMVWKQLKHAVFSLLSFSPFSVVIQYLVLNGYLGNLYEDPLQYGYVYLLLQFPLFLFAADTIMYWSHRMLHTKQFYWIHKAHHRYNPISSFAGSAVDLKDTFLQGLPANIIPLIIFPFYIKMFFGISLFAQLWSIYIHSPTAPRITSEKSIIGNNQFHLKHHLTPTYNYGIYLTFWDRLCGTYA